MKIIELIRLIHYEMTNRKPADSFKHIPVNSTDLSSTLLISDPKNAVYWLNTWFEEIYWLATDFAEILHLFLNK